MPNQPEDMTELDKPVTRRELRAELEAALKITATKDELTRLATKDDLTRLATKDDLKRYVTNEDFKDSFAELRDEMRRHFAVLLESIRAEFRAYYDALAGMTERLTTRVEHLETDHGGRLLSLETRVTRLEKRRK